ncbi:DNA repair protein RecO [Marinicella sediminis]|uniref:DNA repair protein RecO n=1 Tax=Marinicella sediminis TaxID=1792834 RepID=A0ABV7JE26_9GAMM|nr:DNA repair protein RecO [Marinicella sediminis]
MISDSGYVLHKRDYKDSSEIVRLLCRQHGLVDVLAKGSKRPTSSFKNQLQPFLPTYLAFTGKSSLKTLTMAEQTAISRGIPFLNQVSLLYCNELILLLSMDEHTAVRLFPAYEQVIQAIQDNQRLVAHLRRFEWHLSGLMGYQLTIPDSVTETDCLSFDAVNGLVKAAHNQGCEVTTLRQFIAGSSMNQQQWQQLSRLMRTVVDHLVNGQPIRSRELLS